MNEKGNNSFIPPPPLLKRRCPPRKAKIFYKILRRHVYLLVLGRLSCRLEIADVDDILLERAISNKMD